MTDLTTYMILCKTLDNLKAQVWHHQDELIKLREQYKQIEAERDRLLGALERIVTDNDCDPRAEARNALEGGRWNDNE